MQFNQTIQIIVELSKFVDFFGSVSTGRVFFNTIMVFFLGQTSQGQTKQDWKSNLYLSVLLIYDAKKDLHTASHPVFFTITLDYNYQHCRSCFIYMYIYFYSQNPYYAPNAGFPNNVFPFSWLYSQLYSHTP